MKSPSAIPIPVATPVWQSAPGMTSGHKPAGVDLWLLNLQCTQPPDSLELLDDDELARAARFLSNVKKQRFISAHVQLRRIIGFYLGIPPQEVSFRHSQNGKPHVSLKTGATPIHFNLSHSEDRALLAVSCSNVGVDIEFIRNVPNLPRLGRLILAESELECMLSLPQPRQARFFCLHWTVREAFVKAHGGGLGSLLGATVSVVATRGPYVRIATTNTGADLYARALMPEPGYVGAVAAQADDWDLRYYAASGLLERMATTAPATSSALER